MATDEQMSVSRTVARWVATQRVAVSVVLAVSLVGLAVPYGASTPGVDGELTLFEWIVSIAAFVAAVLLAIDIARPLRQRGRVSGLACLLAAAVWIAAGVYGMFYAAKLGTGFAVSELIQSVAWAALALYEWRRVTLEPRMVTTDD